MIKIKITTLFILLMTAFSCKAQQNTNSNEDDNIIGTWVAEGSSLSEKYVFLANGTLQKYSDNVIYITYNWEVLNESNSGVKSKYLEIVNILNSNDKKDYEISALTESILVLIYQRKNNYGIGKPVTYIKQ